MKSLLKTPWPNRTVFVLAGVAFFSMGVYLAFSGVYFHIGFPLDDAWIHQTYARNLALHGEWSFLPGEISGGSTAPLWSILLAVGNWMKLTPFIWTYLLGACALWGLAVLGESLLRRMVSSYHPHFPWVGVTLALEWHLVWAAASGMETLLFALLVTASLALIISGTQRHLILGLLIGLSVWVRPDGVTLLGPAVLVILLTQSSWSTRFRALISLGVGFGILVVFYLLFNLIISGSPLPNTFYAKQAEYAVYQKLPLLVRFGREAVPVLTGVGLFLLPGMGITLVSSIRRRTWGVLAAAIWFVGFLVLYAWRLPVTYQYGRYIMPAMPIFFLLGLSGFFEFVLAGGEHLRWIIKTFWQLATGAVLIVFWALGAYYYARDVAYIDSEMVATAKWVSANLPPDALVAAHDIGALGYFGGHKLVDLAGLVSPDVIPFLRDENQLAKYLDQQGVSYLVTFPDWYPFLTSTLIPVYTTGAPFAMSMGGQNMTVYVWPGP